VACTGWTYFVIVNCFLTIVVVAIMSEVEEGAVYQIEDVWDGTQWHKSKKTFPPDDAGDARGRLVH